MGDSSHSSHYITLSERPFLTTPYAHMHCLPPWSHYSLEVDLQSSSYCLASYMFAYYLVFRHHSRALPWENVIQRQETQSWVGTHRGNSPYSGNGSTQGGQGKEWVWRHSQVKISFPFRKFKDVVIFSTWVTMEMLLCRGVSQRSSGRVEQTRVP